MVTEAGKQAEEKLDVVEVTDEIVRTSRYGQRNYRNSIGADNRRHWRGDFVVEEEEVEGEEQVVEPEVFEQKKQEVVGEVESDDDLLSQAEQTWEHTEPADDDAVGEDDSVVVEPSAEEEEEKEIQASDVGNIADVVHGNFDDEAPEHDEEEIENFFDPLKDVEGLEDVVSDPDSEQSVEVSTDEDEADAEERIDTVS